MKKSHYSKCSLEESDSKAFKNISNYSETTKKSVKKQSIDSKKLIQNLSTNITTTMKNVLRKIAEAKKSIASQKITKEWKNTFSNYNYFTPEQVNAIVQKACDEQKLLTKFDLIRDEFWIQWQLTIFDIETDENIVFVWATAIPEIKATNVAQQIWWCMTYTERYLKMTAFWIADNSLDFDTTENTEKTVNSEKKEESKWTKRFNKEQLENLKANKDYLKKFESSDLLLQDIQKLWYSISKDMKLKIADVRASVE